MKFKQVSKDIYKLTNNLIHRSEFKTEEEFQKIVNNKINPFSAIISTKGVILVFDGIDKLSLYEYLKNTYYQMKKEIMDTVTINDFTKSLNKILLKSKMDKAEITNEIIQNMFEEILNQPISNYLIIKGIYGVKLNNNEDKFSLGPFDIYYQLTYKKILDKKYPPPLDFLWHNWQYDYLVTINIKARSQEKAKELADKMLYQFELFIYFAIGHRKEEFYVNIISKVTYKHDSYLIFDEENLGANYSNDFVDIIPLDDKYFIDNDIGNNKIWELLLPKAKTDIQKRIITAIEWIGKANSEVNNKNRFIFYVFAIESMLTFQEKSFITPAIAHSISESSAIILGDNYEDRIIMEENVKEIYSIRSAIAHGSEKEVSDNELNLVMNISRNIVIQFLTNTELTEINNIDQFIEYLKKKKYK
jgi:hypothetical protein